MGRSQHPGHRLNDISVLPFRLESHPFEQPKTPHLHPIPLSNHLKHILSDILHPIPFIFKRNAPIRILPSRVHTRIIAPNPNRTPTKTMAIMPSPLSFHLPPPQIL